MPPPPPCIIWGNPGKSGDSLLIYRCQSADGANRYTVPGIPCQLTRPGEDTWIRCIALMRLLKPGKPTYLGNFLLTRANPLPCAVYGLRKLPKRRIHKTRRGLRAQSKASRTNAAREKEPWLIATSLPEGNALTHAVINAYRKRMQIEEGCRDTKSERFGLGLNLAMSRSKERH